ncbi:hypothetical protein [Nonomuraea typhae]|uniref:Resolvase/invertase-type recombinase catalytic domain-containing protein n=1 Tax=Nonomuraea typhae TaxID=2603600 RepID=A0ABW7Z4J8_9ACTN
MEYELELRAERQAEGIAAAKRREATGAMVPGAARLRRPHPTWDRDWKLLTGWKRWIVLSGTEHQSFTDTPLLADALGITPAAGALPAARAAELTRTYAAAFLDQHLKSQRQPLLDKPSSRYPEAKFCPATCAPS